MNKEHVCGVCKAEFDTEQEYLDHECETGYTPKDNEHQGPEFAAISEAALKRGEDKKEQ